MHVLLRNAAAKPEWVAKLSLFLHDAAAPEFAYDEATLTFCVTLYRVGHELRRKRVRFWFLTSWTMPRVPCVLSIAPVRVVSINSGDERWRGMDQLAGFDVAPGGSIDVSTQDASARLEAMGPVSISVADSGEPDETVRVTDVGAPLLPDELVAEIVGTSDA